MHGSILSYTMNGIERTSFSGLFIFFFLFFLIFIYIFAFASFDSYTVHYTIVFLRDKQTNIQLHLFHSSTGEFCSFYCHCVTDTMLCSSAHISFERSVTLLYNIFFVCTLLILRQCTHNFSLHLSIHKNKRKRTIFDVMHQRRSIRV